MLATFAWVLMHFINQTEKKIGVFSWSRVEVSLMIFRALQEEEREEEVWEEEEPPILERGRSDRMEDKVSPHQSARLIYPSYVGLFFCLKKHCFLTFLWEILGVPMLELLFNIDDYKSVT